MRTAVAQAELQDRELPGAYHQLVFRHPDGTPLPIDTTRPELLAACVAVVAHPDDERYQPLFGQTVTTPLFGAEVPIVAHRLADPEKGTGAAMVCTFGDTTDVTWWRELSLPIRADRPARRPAAPDHLGRGRLVVGRSRRRAGRLRRAGRQERQAGAERGSSSCSPRPAPSTARPARSPTR